MYCVPGTCNVCHSSRLFWFGRQPAPVLHLFAGPVWCGVNNIQTSTHAVISIHSEKQCRTPSLLWGWHLARAKYTWQKLSIFLQPIMFITSCTQFLFYPKHVLYKLITWYRDYRFIYFFILLFYTVRNILLLSDATLMPWAGQFISHLWCDTVGKSF